MDRLAEIRVRVDDINAKWNVLDAQADRLWLLKRVDELQARVTELEGQLAARPVPKAEEPLTP